MPIDYSAPRRGKGKSKLAALRIAAGLTQEELARLSGVSVFVVKEIEAGRTNRRTLESLVRIAAAIGVTPLDIIKEDDAADGPTPEDLAKAATVPGVSWSASNRAWVARIGVRGERIALGSYRHLDDAIAAGEEAEAVYGRPRRGRSASSKNSDEPGDGK